MEGSPQTLQTPVDVMNIVSPPEYSLILVLAFWGAETTAVNQTACVPP